MNPLIELMPEMVEHEGVWQGAYRHIDVDGNTVDEHKSRVECIFPDQGAAVYIQRNQFTWADGRTHELEFSGVLEGDRIYWNTETFQGYGWVASHNVLLLELERKDVPSARFYESIVMGPDKKNRARTWHWFNREGVCYQRTLCDESLQPR